MKKRDFFVMSILSFLFWALFIDIFIAVRNGFTNPYSALAPLFVIGSPLGLILLFSLFVLFFIAKKKEGALSSSGQRLLLAFCIGLVFFLVSIWSPLGSLSFIK
jgi:hypothetical protein